MTHLSKLYMLVEQYSKKLEAFGTVTAEPQKSIEITLVSAVDNGNK